MWPRLTILLPALLLTTLNARAAETNEWFRPPDIGQFQTGRHVYQKHCVACHGPLGKGDGELVRDWEVPPRNFRRAEFKYRSTPYGSLPADEDLRRTIRRGLAGSAMPTFQQLRDREIDAVINYLKTFSPKWRQPEHFAAPVSLPEAPDWLAEEAAPPEALDRGSEVFQQACAACHGATGKGNGPAIATMTDSQGNPIRPADLTGALRSGPDPEDAFRTIATGINGTPMAGFRDALADAQIWSVIAFLGTLPEDGGDATDAETGLPSGEEAGSVDAIP